MSFGYEFHAPVVFAGSGRVQPPQFKVFLPYLTQRSHSLAAIADVEVKATGATLSHCSFTPRVKIILPLPDSSKHSHC